MSIKIVVDKRFVDDSFVTDSENGMDETYGIKAAIYPYWN